MLNNQEIRKRLLQKSKLRYNSFLIADIIIQPVPRWWNNTPVRVGEFSKPLTNFSRQTSHSRQISSW